MRSPSPSKDRSRSLAPLLASVSAEFAVASDTGGSSARQQRNRLGLVLGLIVVLVGAATLVKLEW